VRSVFSYAKLLVLEMIRQPSFLAATTGFPMTFYFIFGVPEAQSMQPANFLLASFCSFTVLGVLFVQFGNGLAQERESMWSMYLRTLPLTAWQMFLGRVLANFALAAFAVIGVGCVGVFFTPVHLEPAAWVWLVVGLVGGAIPFLCMGWVLGFFTSSKTALPLGNLVYLPLSYAGGLWIPPELLPEKVRPISEYLLTRHYGEVVWAVARGESWRLENWLWILGYTVLFGALAVWGFRRDHMERFS